MKKRRPTWHAAASAASDSVKGDTLQIWTRHPSGWTEPAHLLAFGTHVDAARLTSRSSWTVPVRDSLPV